MIVLLLKQGHIVVNLQRCQKRFVKGISLCKIFFTDIIFNAKLLYSQYCLKGVCAILLPPTALYFYRASKKSLHKPRANFRNMLFQINFSFNYYLQLHLESPQFFKIPFRHQNSTFSKIFIISVYDC